MNWLKEFFLTLVKILRVIIFFQIFKVDTTDLFMGGGVQGDDLIESIPARKEGLA